MSEDQLKKELESLLDRYYAELLPEVPTFIQAKHMVESLKLYQQTNNDLLEFRIS